MSRPRAELIRVEPELARKALRLRNTPTYESINGSSVFMRNNVAYKIVGIGAVRIRMHGTVKTLKNVRHVPDLKRNLISLGTLDSLGYKYSGGGGVIRVNEGS